MGNITSPSLFDPEGTDGVDRRIGSSYQLLEAMSQDIGADANGFINNFAYGTLQLGGTTTLSLWTSRTMPPGSGSEAVYVLNLVVPSGSILDLNGLHLYAENMQVNGTVVNGTITQVIKNVPYAYLTVASVTAPSSSTVDRRLMSNGLSITPDSGHHFSHHRYYCS